MKKKETINMIMKTRRNIMTRKKWYEKNMKRKYEENVCINDNASILN